MILGLHLVVGSEKVVMVDLEAVALVVAVVADIGQVAPMVAGAVLMVVGMVEVNLVVMEDTVLVVVWGLTGKSLPI